MQSTLKLRPRTHLREWCVNMAGVDSLDLSVLVVNHSNSSESYIFLHALSTSRLFYLCTHALCLFVCNHSLLYRILMQ